MREWNKQAVKRIQADFQRSADTHLLKITLPGYTGIDVYLKDESRHSTGSLKHRLARSLFLYALCNGQITEKTPVIEASSGNTAVSEAYFAHLIGVPFYAVMPRSTSQHKINLIERYGGHCHFVDCATAMHKTAQELAISKRGVFLDQFKYAERATDWRGNNNIAESIFTQMQAEPYPIPYAIIMSAGTGGTSATIGRYIRYQGFDTQLWVVDPENSAFYTAFINGDFNHSTGISSRIEGIGRPEVEASFVPSVIDDMLQVPDTASVAAMRWLYQHTGHMGGPSTGTNLWGLLMVADQMRQHGHVGSLVTLMCDAGERYLDTYYNDQWVAENIGDISATSKQLNEWLV
ncbi:MAG: PLP-dependent cysteine synthase family protein [Pseudomonadales bacterium]